MNTKWASLRVEVGWQAFDAGRAGFNPTRPDPVCLFGFCVTLQDSFSAGLCRLTFGLPCREIESCLLRPSRRSSLEEHSGAVLRRSAAALTET
ncbi:hypothetical protein M9H77_08584 [Catharanthus roseus]|uniref:Uncharacterized protein n=1 Tax=Catharanthus roseus TaxID=4058 RepID=A0ACC0BYD7_CATRO|nr:hypothetical protein M9H77_08584 [Catharanthus roseus]